MYTILMLNKLVKSETKIIDKDFFVSTILLSVVTFTIFEFKTFVDWLSNSNGFDSGIIYGQIQTYTDTVLDFLSENLLTANVSTFIVWGILGMIVYLIITLSSDEASNISDMIKTAFVYKHPKSFKQTSFWLKNFEEGLGLLVVFAMFVAIIILGLKVFVPFSSYMVLLGLYDTSNIGLAIFRIFSGLVSIWLIFASLGIVLGIGKTIKRLG